MLTYQANQVLHIENGTVKPSEIISEDYDDDENYLYECEIASNTEQGKVNSSGDDADKKSFDSVMLEV